MSRQQPLTLGFEDGSFPVNRPKTHTFKTLLLAALLNGLQLHDVQLSTITVDGTDATDAALSILQSLKTKPSVVLLGGISYGGFNFIDPFKLNEEGLPSIIVTTDKPDNKKVKQALQHHFPDWEARWKIYRRLKNFQSVRTNTRENPVFMEAVGIPSREAERWLRQLTKIGRMPEPLRVARMLAHGLTVKNFLETLNS